MGFSTSAGNGPEPGNGSGPNDYPILEANLDFNMRFRRYCVPDPSHFANVQEWLQSVRETTAGAGESGRWPRPYSVCRTLMLAYRQSHGDACYYTRRWSAEAQDRYPAEIVDQDVAAAVALRKREVEEERAQQALWDLEDHFEVSDVDGLLGNTSDPSWLVEGVLVAGQNGVIAGPTKTLKTSVAFDLAVSVCTGKPFLGRFPVPAPKKVMMWTGEIGDQSAEDLLWRICEAKGLERENVAPGKLFQGTGRLPRLQDPEELEKLQQLIRARKVKLLIVDPLYMAIPDASNPASLYSMGGIFAQAGRACQEAGATLLLVHHAVKDLPLGKPMVLADMVFAGLAEYSRQWILVNHRRPYDAGRGASALVLTYGGSWGHGGELAVDVTEGVRGVEGSGRYWQTSVRPLHEATAEEEARKQQADTLRQTRKQVVAQKKVEAHASKVLDALRRLATKERESVPRKEVQELTSLSGANLTKAVTLLVENRQIEMTVERTKRGKQTYEVHWLRLLR